MSGCGRGLPIAPHNEMAAIRVEPPLAEGSLIGSLENVGFRGASPPQRVIRREEWADVFSRV